MKEVEDSYIGNAQLKHTKGMIDLDRYALPTGVFSDLEQEALARLFEVMFKDNPTSQWRGVHIADIITILKDQLAERSNFRSNIMKEIEEEQEAKKQYYRYLLLACVSFGISLLFLKKPGNTSTKQTRLNGIKSPILQLRESSSDCADLLYQQYLMLEDRGLCLIEIHVNGDIFIIPTVQLAQIMLP